jgi:hypothetical protein
MLGIKGQVWIRKNGLLVAQGSNLVVGSGLDLIAKLIAGTGTVLSHMAIGNSGGASLSTMTALQGSELERVALASTTVNSNTIAYNATFGSAISVTVTVREVGIFNAAVGGEMLCRFICSGFDLSAGETAEVDWTMTLQPLTT